MFYFALSQHSIVGKYYQAMSITLDRYRVHWQKLITVDIKYDGICFHDNDDALKQSLFRLRNSCKKDKKSKIFLHS